MFFAPRRSVTREPVRTPNAVIVFTQDSALIEHLLTLAAAVDAPLAVMSTTAELRTQWARAPIILVGTDALATLATADLTRRAGVIAVSLRQEVLAEVTYWQEAVGVGVEGVHVLPAHDRALLDLLVDTVELHTTPAPVVAVLGGCGGAGATTLATHIARTFGRALPAQCLLVDADPLGGGIDIHFQAERIDGLRWPELLATSGRVSAEALRHAIPQVDGVYLVSHERTPAAVGAGALDAVIAAGPRGFGLCVVDVGRSVLLGSGGHEAHAGQTALARATATVVVVPADLPSIAATRAVLAAVQPSMGVAGIVVRHRRGSTVQVRDIQSALGLEVVAEIHDQRSASSHRAVAAIGRSLGIAPHSRRQRRAS